jgi:hypothetical protein
VRRRSLPSPERFKHEVRRFVRRYRFVREYATWNEANHCGEPTCNRPGLVAAYYRKLRQACVDCRVLAAEVLDQPNADEWIRAFRRSVRGGTPKYWGLHNYVEANRFQTLRLRRILAATGRRSEVWLTEVAGIVRRRTRNPETVRRIPESAAHAARVLRFLLDDVLPRNRRITRLYVYHWNASTRTDSWDSALVGPDGRRRPALTVLAQELRSLRPGR